MYLDEAVGILFGIVYPKLRPEQFKEAYLMIETDVLYQVSSYETDSKCNGV